MIYLEEKTSVLSKLIENQFPSYVQENNEKFLKFLASYYELQETKYQPLDIVSNLVDYYNIGYFKKNQLVESTKLSSNLLTTSTTITVESTIGYPARNGYIQIEDEIIFYKTKTATTFVDCVRGTSALILENVPKSDIFLKNSIAAEHLNGVKVKNIAYNYALEFFDRIKSELAPVIPETFASDLDIGNFLKNIKSFYSAKGSLNSHRIFFRILFNDRKFNIIFKSRGSGAEIKINNFGGSIPDPLKVGVKPQIVSGGLNYDNRKDTNGDLINPPVVDVFGSGTGKIINGIRPNKTAIIEVTDIDSNGTITDIDVPDIGENYVGPITARVRPKNFEQDQKVYNSSGTGVGKVEYFDPFKNELILYDVVGYFVANDEIITDDGEKARGFIAKSYATPVTSRNGVEVISEEQNIEFPGEYTFKTSDSKFGNKTILRAKLIDGYFLPGDKLPDAINLIQDKDDLFGVIGVNIEVDNYVSLDEGVFEFEIGTNSDIEQIYLQPTTRITKSVVGVNSSTTNLVITADDTSRFPVKNGILLINGREIHYKSRTFNQFIDCEYFGNETFNINVKDKVISSGRIKYDQEWQSGQTIVKNDFKYYGNNLYVALSDGITGSKEPVHTSGSERDGSFALGDSNPVLWRYYSPNRFDYTFYIDYKNSLIVNPRFEIIGLPGEVIIEQSGALHSKVKYEFSRLDDPNIKVYNFTTSEISDRLSAVLGSNYNKTRETVTDSRFPSYKRLTGFSTQHDYEDYIYVSSSGIPRWWNDIVDTSKQTFTDDENKKISFTDQKLLVRWNKSGLIYDSQAFGNKKPTKKAIGLNIDAIQVNSYKGNTVNYGFVDKFVISAGGDYPVPYTSNGLFDETKYPALRIKNPTSSSPDIIVENNLGLFKLSSKITSIDFTSLASDVSFSSNLTGYLSKPAIEVINENPKYEVTVNLNSTQVNDAAKEINITSHEFNTTDLITYNSNNVNYFTTFKDRDQFFVRKVDNNRISLHRTKSDCLLNRNKVSLENNAVAGSSFKLSGDQKNPINFEPAQLELSYNNGTINNIIIRNSGNGYVSTPTIKITGGGKPDVTIPFNLNGKRIVDMNGFIVSNKTYYLENYYEINDVSGGVFDNTSWNINPPVSFDNGSGAAAVAYTSNGVITTIVLINRGSGYSVPPKVEIFGEGENGVIESIINTNGEVIAFNIVNGGTGYKTAPKIEITPVGSGGLISCKLKEWTFNLNRQLSLYDRIDSYGGYVYDNSDVKPTTNNPQNFAILNYDLDFPKGVDEKQYHLFTTSEKLLAKYTEEKDPFIAAYKAANPGVVLNQSQIFNISGHSPAILVSYDSIPVYGCKKVLKVRNLSILPPTDPNYQNQFHEIKSRYRLKYSTTAAPSGVDSTTYVVGGVTYYVYRNGGPSVLEYPIGSFIEDYEYVVGDENDLDEHNGRFTITPEFPNGRYCYFNTYQSFDNVTNEIVTSQNIDFNGFPYVIGNTFASNSDDYMNNRCRTNDKVPKFFTRIFEKKVDAIPGIFAGLPANEEYPQEDIRLQKTIAETEVISAGSVDSIIIENSGDGYKVGDRLNVDNSLTFGSGFSGIVSKVVGKDIISIVKSLDGKEVTFETSQQNGLSIGDYVYFDYEKPSSPIEVYLHDNAVTGEEGNNVFPVLDTEIYLTEGNSIDQYRNKLIFNVNLNFKYTYKINIPSNAVFNLTYDIDKVNEYFILNDGQSAPIDHIILDVTQIPNRLYLHIGNYIYQINKTNGYYGPRRITEVDDVNNKFTIEFVESTDGYEETNIVYSAKSYGASGPIKEISISSRGSNYRSLPAITGLIKKGTTDEIAGDGNAIIQANSNTIGRIKRVVYDSLGNGFESNINVNYYLNIPSTAKVINNFEIYDIEIIDGGNSYDNVTITAQEDGVTKPTTLQAVVSLGTITSVKVLDGGTNFSKLPNLVITSSQGSGAVLRAKIRRKNIFSGYSITTDINSILFPISVSGKVVNYDNRTSTIEFDEITGEFKDDNIIYTSDGRPYGKLVSIRRTRAYAKAKPYTQLKSFRKDITGNTSEYLQKLTDSNYYQDWSYSITSTRDTKEWVGDQRVNTHPAGFKQFGKKLIERRKSFFSNPADVFKSSVVFTTNLSNNILLKTKLSPCKKQSIYVQNVEDFSIGDYFYGSNSGAIGTVISISEYVVTLEVRGSSNFVTNEVLIEVSPEFAFGILSATDKTLIFWNGIFQEPEESYEISASYVNSIETFVPKFNILPTDKVLRYRIDTPFDILDRKTLKSGDSQFTLSLNDILYQIDSNNIGNFIISIGGSVQKPSDLSISNNVIDITTPISHDSTIFAISGANLIPLTFTGNQTGTVFTIDQTPADDCNLIIFHQGAFQSQLVSNFTLSGDQVTFDETVNITDIFGWYIDDTATCEVVDLNELYKNIALGVWDCTTKNLTKNIESNALKTPESIYEIRKDTIDGTVYPVNSTKVIGFDTKFSYTSPLYSSSYVEVLDRITFNGSGNTFDLTINGVSYTPSNGRESLLVYVNNEILDYEKYSVVGTTISFTDNYTSGIICYIVDFVSEYSSNTNNENGTIIDRLEVQQNGSRQTFNLSDRGVPKYVNNVGDIFVIKNGELKIPSNNYTDHRGIVLSSHTVNDNKLTFSTAPQNADLINLIFFNRQLLPEPTKNVILDKFRCFDGIVDTFPITINGLLFNAINVNNLFVVRNGVVQKPGTDYTISGSDLTFTTPVTESESVFSYYSYDGLNQNILLDNLTNIDGVNTTHNLTNGGNPFTPPAADDLMVVRNGVVQNAIEDFTVTGSTIDFTTALTTTENIFILYTHGAEEISITNSSSISSSVTSYTLGTTLATDEREEVVLYADGVPRFYQRNDFTVENNGTEIHLNHTDGISPTQVFVVKYPSVSVVDDIADCPDGVRTSFKLLYNGQNIPISSVVEDADILISVNGVVLYPGVEYVLNSNRGLVEFSNAPQINDEIFMVRMSGNNTRSLSSTGTTNQYTISVSESSEKENVVVFSNNTWKFAELGDFTWNNDSTITLSSPHTTGELFAIKFFGVFNLLDQINTPLNGSITKFNLFDGEENFIPLGTVENSSLSDETSLIVVKNGKYLNPKIDYTLVGDIKSQIQFSIPPISTDAISVRSVGSFEKLDTITSGSGTSEFNLTKGGQDYYPNSHIERPRQLENQIVVIVDGNIQSPLSDYYVHDNKLIFTNNVTFTTGIVILDFRGTDSDVQVFNRFNQLSPGDQIIITGEESPRTVTSILSPTVLETSSYTGVGPTGFSANSVISNGEVTSVNITSGGLNYKDPVVLRTIGTGTGAKLVATIDKINGGVIDTSEVLYPGYNIFNNHTVYPTVYANTYRKQQINKSQVRKGTKLTSNINSTVETIPLNNTFELPSNSPTVSVTSSSGSAASFKVYISGGEVRKIDIISGGSGYDDRDITVELTGGGGSGCVLEPVLDNNGTITDLIIRNPGIGYDTFRVIIHNVDNNNIVNAEVIEYTYVDSNGIDGCTRGVLGDAASHSQNDIVYFDSYL